MANDGSEFDLFVWQNPEGLRAKAGLMRTRLRHLALRNAGRDFREAYVAARFAGHRQASHVRLLPPRQTIPTPDFAIKVGGAELLFETTESDRPGRKRGAEEFDAGDILRAIPDHHWVCPAEYLDLVRQRVQSKAGKAYDKCNGLLVWSNAFPIADEEPLTIDWWRDACLPARDAFAEVWVGRNRELEDAFLRVF